MTAPRLEPEPSITLQVRLRPVAIGTSAWGSREEVWFDGTATSPLWEGERAVSGIDHITVSSGGTYRIDVHVLITGDDEVVTYRGHGRATAVSLFEGVTFDTPSERLAWLNDAVAVGRGRLDGDDLTIELFVVTP
jgi:hypothetical protein